jgi:class 3 adenylate cyclase
MSSKNKKPRIKPKPSQRKPRISASHRALYNAGIRYFEAEPWRYLASEDTFALEVPGEPYPLAILILGAAGQEFGISAVRGPSAAGLVQAMNRGEVVDRSLLDVVSLSLDKYRQLSGEFRMFYKRAGVRPSSGAHVPLFFVKRNYQVARAPNGDEVEILTYVINGTLEAMARGMLRHGETITPSGLVTLELSGDPCSPKIERKGEYTTQTIEEKPTPTLLVDHLALRQLPALDETWIVACRTMPIRIRGITDEIRIVLVVDEQTGMVLDAETVLGAESNIQAARHLVDLMLGKKKGAAFHSDSRMGRPRELRMIDSELYAILGTQLKGAGIACELLAHIPAEMREALDGLVEHMGRR